MATSMLVTSNKSEPSGASRPPRPNGRDNEVAPPVGVPPGFVFGVTINEFGLARSHTSTVRQRVASQRIVLQSA